ncbi:hypothetical protein [Lentzea cavernae]|uniref:Uncharacterized protein n=1 Tax=Lentzea cavernae TaxID=2020703 RepID=A0ABQ3MU93_9PSEU|nr:hypothetical protein [Lentzea cavernae]GHH57920.1 hypothetical protein GCM10017774_78450 [Lentzea cavernae]
MKIRIVADAAREIAQHVTTYVRPTSGWSEVQVMRECRHGCKLHVRRRGAILQYALHHGAAYGCQLGRDEATRVVPVSVAPKAKARWVCPGDCGE